MRLCDAMRFNIAISSNLNAELNIKNIASESYKQQKF